MTLDATFFDRHAAFAVAQFPQSMTWNGAAYACMADAATVQDAPDMAGFERQIALTLSARTAIFTNGRPATGDLVTYAGDDYRIGPISNGPDDVWLIMQCTEEDEA